MASPVPPHTIGSVIEDKSECKKGLIKTYGMGAHGWGLSQWLHYLSFTNFTGNSLKQLTLLCHFAKRSCNSEWLSLVLGHTDSEPKCQDLSSDSFVSKTYFLCTTLMFSFLPCDLLHTKFISTESTSTSISPNVSPWKWKFAERAHLRISQALDKLNSPMKQGQGA